MFKHILLPVDLGHLDTQTRAIDYAVAETKAFGGTLHVMTIVPDFGMSIVGSFFPEGFEKKAMDEAEKVLHRFVDDRIGNDVQTQCVIGHGTIYEEILRVAKQCSADLIVMASHRPELKDYLLGPNAARVVRHADCSVMVIRG